MGMKDLSDKELIEKYGGGYGRNSIVQCVRSFLTPQIRVPSAFAIIARQFGIHPEDEVYQLLLKAVAREISSHKKSTVSKPSTNILFVFRGKEVQIVGGHIRYQVTERGGDVVYFGRDQFDDPIYVSAKGSPSRRLLSEATEYAKKHWKR